MGLNNKGAKTRRKEGMVGLALKVAG